MNKFVKKKLKKTATYSLLFLVLVVLLLIKLKQNLVFFYTPSEYLLYGKDKKLAIIRLGGLVKELDGNGLNGSCAAEEEPCHLVIISDEKTSIPIVYFGILPALLKVGQGVIFEIESTEGNSISSRKAIIKHDEKYISKEKYQEMRRKGVQK